MSEFDFPAGTYLGINGELQLGRGGQTRVILLRQRAMLELAGIDMPVVTFAPHPEYERVRAGFIEQGHMAPQSRVVNIVDWFTNGNADARPAIATDDDRDLLKRYERREIFREDGRLWSVEYLDSDDTPVAQDFLRDDGSHALRYPLRKAAQAGISTKHRAFDRSGDVILEEKSRRALYRHWIETIVPEDGSVFLMSDSRFAIRHLLDLGERFHALHQMHAPHIKNERFWHSTVIKSYRPLMDFQYRLDGLLSLSDRQRRDIALRYGPTDNLFVIPNPIDMPEPPSEPVARSRRRVVTMARIFPQKRLDRAIRAFAVLLDHVPDAVFDIYGQGPVEDELRGLIDELDISHAVTMHGYEPQARQSLWSATCYWMTSSFEGYPLAVLEAMSHGCPPVCFDIKYGPREQIADGVNGFLVDEDDLDELVRRTVSLMRDGDRLERMSAAAISTAREHSLDRWMQQTARICFDAHERKPRRTRIDRVRVEGCALSLRPLLLRDRLGRRATLSGRLHVDGSGGRPFDDTEVDVRLQVCATRADAVADLPVTTRIEDTTVHLQTEVTQQRVRQSLTELGVTDGEAYLRVCLTWGNSASVHEVTTANIHIAPQPNGDLGLTWPAEPPRVTSWLRRLPGRVVRKARRVAGRIKRWLLSAMKR